MFQIFVLSLCYFIVSVSTESDDEKILALIEKKEQAVKNICNAVRLYYSSEETLTTCKRYEMCDKNLVTDNSAHFSCLSGFGSDEQCGCDSGTSKLSLVYPAVRYPSSVDKDSEPVAEFVCFTESLKNVFYDNFNSDENIKWQYIGSPDGVFNQYPGKSDFYRNTRTEECHVYNPTCPEYDPRFRPWYISASSGPKDIILLADVSASMGTETSNGKNRMDLLRDAAESIVDGLGIYDRLSIVTFNVVAETCSFAEDDMIRMTDNNKEAFKNCINLMSEFSSTNFEAGFEKAFAVLSNRKKESIVCHTAILFLTDGTITSGRHGDDFLDYIKILNEDIGAKIFSFSLGEEADDDVPKALSCANKGVWMPVADDENLREKMSSYYKYFSYSDRSRGVSWSEKYEDFSGLGNMTTAAQGCFSEDKELIGVAGVDVLISEFEEITNFDQNVAQQLFDRSNVCDDLHVPEERLEELRNFKCTSVFAANPGVTVGIIFGLVIGLVIIVVCVVLLILLLFVRKRKHMGLDPEEKKKKKKKAKVEAKIRQQQHKQNMRTYLNNHPPTATTHQHHQQNNMFMQGHFNPGMSAQQQRYYNPHQVRQQQQQQQPGFNPNGGFQPVKYTI